MHRCYIQSADWQSPEIALSEHEAHHLFDVLRAVKDDEVLVFDGQGRSARASVRSVEPPVLTVSDAEVVLKQQQGGITLIQAIPKGKRMELIVEKATELGVSEIVPVLTERVVSVPKGERAARRVEKWRKTSVAAARQCGADWVPSVSEIVSLEKALEERGPFDLFLVGALTSDAKSLREVLRDKARFAKTVALLVGPEGDLSLSELDMAVAKGAIPVSFGELVLRVETAAIYGLSILAYETAVCLPENVS